MAANDDDDSVGYGRPPKAHRFEPGRSGNPKGRPLKSRTTTEPVIQKVLRRKVEATVDGRKQRITVAEAIALQMVEQASRGKISALRFLMTAQAQVEAATPPEAPRSLEAEIVASLVVDMLEVVEVLVAADALYLRRSGGFAFERSGFAQFFTNCGPEFMARSKDLKIVVSEREHDPQAVTWPGDEPLLDLYERLMAERQSG